MPQSTSWGESLVRSLPSSLKSGSIRVHDSALERKDVRKAMEARQHGFQHDRTGETRRGENLL